MVPSFCCVCIGPPESGKTSFCLNFAWYNRNKYPVGYAATGSDAVYLQLKQIFGPLFTRNYYDEKDHVNLIERKKMMVMENGEKNKNCNIMEIFDDFGDDPRVYRNRPFKSTLKNGTQHWSQACFINLQALCDFKRTARQAFRYAVIFAESNIDEREKLFRNFGGVCGSLKVFNALMDTLTGNYTALVFDLRKQTMEDGVFYYRTDDPKTFTDTGTPGDWRFGAPECWEWQKTRYNENYQEQVDY